MPRQKVYPRYKDMLQLHDERTLKKLDLSWCETESDLKVLITVYKEMTEAAARWFTIEMGTPLTHFHNKDGAVWCVPDETDNSIRYKQLRNKAIRFEVKIVNRLNEWRPKL